ncbi:MAG TPA: efflux RND transporter periplasmic adaptor subunit [Tepidisphaeraceae bacterium]|jgi:Cu(I)/Ag(I) efflux system membrane fusion protein
MSTNFLQNASTVTKVFFARLRFLAVFVVAGLIVGYWDNIRNHIDKWTRPAVAPEVARASASQVEYYCSMHPNIIREQPGNCPVCGMPLIKRIRGEEVQLPADVLARVQLSPQRVALANVHTTAAEYKTLVREIHALGLLDYDETKVAQLSARVAGRADQLFLEYAGHPVEVGDPAYSLYSPEVYTAQREYLLARKRVNDLPKDASASTRADASAVYNATMQKLVLWGVSTKQLEEMEHEYDQSGKVPAHLIVTSPISGIVIRKDIFEGGYVNVGDKPYTIADLRNLWLRAKVYEADVPLVHVGEAVDVVVEALPNEVFKGSVTFAAYQLDPQTRTMDARIEVKNDDMRLKPGMFADAVIRVPIVRQPASQPTSQPAATAGSESSARASVAYADALTSYLAAQKLLAGDKVEGVANLLNQSVAKLATIKEDRRVADSYRRLADSANKTMGQDLEAVRETFKDVSAAMIEIGKVMKLPADAAAIQVFRCPMKKANWLQESGTPANPFYGSTMLECGGPVEALPKADGAAPAPTMHQFAPAGKTLAIPRSAVIDTGRHKIVYVESSPGVYDMRAVELGQPAEDFYPVVSGLEEGDRVVTVGAFLIDSENRLNPTTTAHEH